MSLPADRRDPGRDTVLALGLLIALLSGCGNQTVIEGVSLSDGALIGDPVIDTVEDEAETAAGDPYAQGNPYEAAEDGERNLGPNAPGYIPETIY
ncbi:hypothetical protein CKO25_05420 [Thiocapsa imhoffii]|uniref:Uncharacterized protein n=1 Tax=Thiocapsa imhoffii TaxID=382777 RepID=A0A9X0WGF5_9GAMM|nr:hypothetical protein [Thiocapsa imhoffii]MBK1644098.1 hypothetical protein [Thiocapsa imhoffii]